jgi:hypothetical protein
MKYNFKCAKGHKEEVERSIHVGPPGCSWPCMVCGWAMERDWQADAPMLDTSACRDANDIPHNKRVASAWDRGSPGHVERQFRKQIEQRRSQIRDAGGQRGSIKQTHSVPAHLYHGKIKETGDKSYWNDPKNLAKHKECKVD